jgi:peptidoglycan/LPS O-acetylase OafA/YrhL
MVSAIFYYSNYRLPMVDIQQSWSLSVEEQFYFLWPVVIVLLGMRRATLGCALALIVAPVFRALTDLNYWNVTIAAFAKEFPFECACDAIAIGCLLAIFRERLWSIRTYRTVVDSPLVWSIALVALAIWIANPSSIIRNTISIPVLNVGIAMLLDRYMRMPLTVIGRMLNAGPVAWLGTVSYSLYLWQQPWMFSGLFVPLRLLGAFVCATTSFYLVERPGLRLRRSLERRFKEGTRLGIAV